MAIRRITISVQDGVAARIKKAAGKIPVSAWVTGLIEEHLEDAELDRKWDEFCREAAPSPKEVKRAEALFSRITKAKRRRGAA